MSLLRVALVVLMAIGAQVCRSEVVEITFSGTITGINQFFIDQGVSEFTHGDDAVLIILADTLAEDTDLSTDVGHYFAGTSFTFQMGQYSISDGGEGYIAIANNLGISSPKDAVSFETTQEFPHDSIAGREITSIVATASDSSSTAFHDDELGIDKFDFPSFDASSIFVYTTGGNIEITVEEITFNQVALVPLPATAWLMASALISLLGLGRYTFQLD